MIPSTIDAESVSSAAHGMGHRARAALCAKLLALSLLSHASWARAETSAAQATLAEALFREARTLMQDGHVPEACAKFAESQRLDPAGGTLLNLGLCHEREGKLATAWSELREALGQARAEGNAEREKIANDRIQALEPSLPRLSVFVRPSEDASNLVVMVDGVELRRAAWGVAVPADPGTHVVRASRPGRADWSMRVELKTGRAERVDVPELTPLQGARKPGAEPSKGEASSQQDGQDHEGRRIAGIISGGLGLAALGLGSYFGLQAIDQRSKSDAECPSDTTCTEEGVRLNDSAQQAAWFANIGIGLGLIGLGAGTYLIVTAGSSDTRADRPRTGSLELRGIW